MKIVRFFESLLQDVRFGVRLLKSSPGSTAVIVLTLAFGIGVNAALYSIIYSVLLKPLPYQHPESLVFLAQRYPSDDILGASDFLYWQSHVRSFEWLMAFQPVRREVNANGITIPVLGVAISDSLRRTLGITPILGRDFFSDEVGFRSGGSQSRLVLVSDEFFHRSLGGNPEIIGKTLTLSDNSYVIVGVLPPDFHMHLPGTFGDLEGDVELVESMVFDPATLRGHGFAVEALGRLKSGVAFQTAQGEMEVLVADVSKQYPYEPKHDLRMIPLHEYMVGRVRLSLEVLWGAAGFVLLMACINVANLLLARATVRTRETAVRVALGAGRVRLLRQFLTETLVLVFAGGMAGLLLAFWTIRSIVSRSLIDNALVKRAALNWNVVLFSFALCVVVGLLSGTTPALAGIRTAPIETIKEGGKGGGAVSRRSEMLRGIVVACQVALTIVLLTGAGPACSDALLH